MSQSGNLVEYSCHEKIAKITLNRPEKLNAVTDEMIIELAATLRRFDLDPDAMVGVLSGNGRAFCAGADIQQRHHRPREELMAQGGPGAGGPAPIDMFGQGVNSKPLVAAAHGYAVGLGLGFLMRCELVVAEAGTKFQITEVARGLTGARFWAQMKSLGVGIFAEEVSLSGRIFTAEEAHAADMITCVAPKGQYMERAMEYARSIAANPPLSVREIVRARRYRSNQLEREVMYGGEMLKLYLSEDFQEASRAFTEKRKPNDFKGR